MTGDIKTAQRELTARVMGKKGVEGTAIGQDGSGDPCLKVYVSDTAAERSMPGSVGGFKVVVEKTGGFQRL